MCVCVCICMYVYVYLYVYICVYVYIYVCICILQHKQTGTNIINSFCAKQDNGKFPISELVSSMQLRIEEEDQLTISTVKQMYDTHISAMSSLNQSQKHLHLHNWETESLLKKYISESVTSRKMPAIIKLGTLYKRDIRSEPRTIPSNHTNSQLTSIHIHDMLHHMLPSISITLNRQPDTVFRAVFQFLEVDEDEEIIDSISHSHKQHSTHHHLLKKHRDMYVKAEKDLYVEANKANVNTNINMNLIQSTSISNKLQNIDSDEDNDTKLRVSNHRLLNTVNASIALQKGILSECDDGEEDIHANSDADEEEEEEEEDIHIHMHTHVHTHIRSRFTNNDKDGNDVVLDIDTKSESNNNIVSSVTSTLTSTRNDTNTSTSTNTSTITSTNTSTNINMNINPMKVNASIIHQIKCALYREGYTHTHTHTIFECDDGDVLKEDRLKELWDKLGKEEQRKRVLCAIASEEKYTQSG